MAEINENVLKILFPIYFPELALVESFPCFKELCELINDCRPDIFVWTATDLNEDLKLLFKECTESEEKKLTFDPVRLIKTIVKAKLPAVLPSASALAITKLSEFKCSNRNIVFLPERPDEVLTAADYNYFLSGIHHKLKKLDSKVTPSRITLPCTPESLLGLMAYCDSEPVMPCKQLNLYCSELKERKQLLADLKTLLMQNTLWTLDEIVLDGPEGVLDDAFIKELTDFVKIRNVRVRLALPKEWQDSDYQKSIDEVTSDRVRDERIESLKRRNPPATEVKSKAVRTRPRIVGKLHASVDLELQQEQQAELAIEATTESTEEEAEAVAREEPLNTVYDFKKFAESLRSGEFSAHSNPFLTMSKDAQALWAEWFGCFIPDDFGIFQKIFLTKEACEELLSFKDHFKYGFDINNLPPGFTVKKDRNNVHIHFDAQLKVEAAYNPLQVRTDKSHTLVPICNTHVNKLLESFTDEHPLKTLWWRINNPYDREMKHLFSLYLPTLVRLSSEQLTLLNTLCIKEGKPINKEGFNFLLTHSAELKEILNDFFASVDTESQVAGLAAVNTSLTNTLNKLFPEEVNKALCFIKQYEESSISDLKSHPLCCVLNKEALDWIQEHTAESANPRLDLDAVIQLYLDYGKEGLNAFEKIIDSNKELVCSLIHPSPQGKPNYRAFLGKEYQEALKTIAGFGSDERQWWDELFKQHAAAQNDINLVSLVNAFVEFRTQLRRLPAGGEQIGLRGWPIPFPFKGIKSMPTALSRIITVLKNTQQENRQLQWEHIQLDLSQTGVIKALNEQNYTRWEFFLPVMKIEPSLRYLGKEEDKPLVIDLYPSLTAREWLDYIENTEGYPAEISDSLLLYRHVSNQPYKHQLALEFYINTEKMITESETVKTNKPYLYLLFAFSTTGYYALDSSLSTKEQQAIAAGIIKELETAPLAGPHILKFLCSLEYIPPLPEAQTLFVLLKACLSNPLTIAADAMRLSASLSAFSEVIRQLGNVAYQGLRNYSSEDFKDRELYYNYLKTLQAIVDLPPQLGLAKNYLVSNISNFKLKTADINALQLKLNNPEHVRRLTDTLGELQQLNKSLAIDDLHYILDEVIKAEHKDKKVADVLKSIKLTDGRSLSASFPEGYFDAAPKITDSLSVLISNQFTGQEGRHIIDLLHRFKRNTDAQHYRKIIEKLSKITKDLDPLKRNLLITRLSSSQGLFTEDQPLSETHPFIKLLNSLNSSKAIDLFLDMTNNPETRALESLACRYEMYQRQLVPFIEGMSKKHLGSAELSSLAKEIILATPEDELFWGAEGVKGILGQLNVLIDENKGCGKPFNNLFANFIKGYSGDGSTTMLDCLTQFVGLIKTSFADIEDKNDVIALCLHFKEQPKLLKDLCEKLQELEDPETRKVLFKIAVNLLNNGSHGCTIDTITEQISTIASTVTDDNKKNAHQALMTCYKTPPFPPIHDYVRWHAEALKTDNYVNNLKSTYDEFAKKPFARDSANGFNFIEADRLFGQIKINGQAPSSIEQLRYSYSFEQFQHVTKELRSKTMDELIKIYSDIKAKPPEEIIPVQLIAVAAELLYRSKGMEINTSQYLALLTMMNSDKPTTSQIGTGEGKSRIMMIALACQFALGKTVDFVTSDATLASRDFLAYRGYFELLGAKTSLISADSSPETYQQKGINFSDPASLSLFRNKAITAGEKPSVMDPIPKDRALLLDEADKTYFDLANMRFNYSKKAEYIKDMEWFYPVLMEYFSQEKLTLGDSSSTTPLDLYYDDIDKSREQLLLFARSHCSKEQLARLQAVPDSQIEQWQLSAITANQLEYNKDFVLEADVRIKTPTGIKITSQARLLFEGRMSKDAKFSFGVQQCLHARLNRLKITPEKGVNQALSDDLRGYEHPFYIEPEKQIVYSSTSKSLLDDYSEGTLRGVTGTAGSFIERQEARKLYKDMQFIDLPRAKGLNRVDKPIRLTANAQQQFALLVEQIKEARAKNQPVLIIAEDEGASDALFKKLQAQFPRDLQQIHSKLSIEEENKRIATAGIGGQITVATDMVGRGTDIILDAKAQVHGLNVMLTYLPRVRDLHQIIGRSGRFGAQGESSLVLNKSQVEKTIGRPLGFDFFRNVEVFIEKEQAILDRTNQLERIIKNTVNDFRMQYSSYFFDKIFNNELEQGKKDRLFSLWSAFASSCDMEWNNEIWPAIQHHLTKSKVDVGAVNALLAQYKEKIDNKWSSLVKECDEIYSLSKDSPHLEASKLELSPISLELIESFDDKIKGLSRYKQFDDYDKGHDGRAVVYTNWYTPWIATFKGYANLFLYTPFTKARQPFANLRAAIEGRGQLFPNTRAFFANLFDGLPKVSEKKQTDIKPSETKEESSFVSILTKLETFKTQQIDRPKVADVPARAPEVPAEASEVPAEAPEAPEVPARAPAASARALAASARSLAASARAPDRPAGAPDVPAR